MPSSSCRLLWNLLAQNWAQLFRAAPTQSRAVSEWQSQRKQEVYHLRGTNCKQDLQTPEVLDTGSTCETLEDPSQNQQAWRHATRKRENLKEAEAPCQPQEWHGKRAYRGQLLVYHEHFCFLFWFIDPKHYYLHFQLVKCTFSTFWEFLLRGMPVP